MLGARLDRVVDDPGRALRPDLESMTREAPWRFLDMGRRLERAVNTALMIERTLPGRDGGRRAAAARGPARRGRQRDDLPPPLPRDAAGGAGGRPAGGRRAQPALASSSSWRPWPTTSPRSPATSPAARRSAEERLAFEALSEIRLVDVETVCALAGEAARRRWGRCSRDLVHKLQALSDALFAAYLTPATISARARVAGDRLVIYRVKHITAYGYGVPVSTSHHDLHVLLRGSPGSGSAPNRCYVDAGAGGAARSLRLVRQPRHPSGDPRAAHPS